MGRNLIIMDDRYYIFKDIALSHPDNIGLGVRIFKMSSNLPPYSFKEGEGPYNSIRGLKRNSKIFQEFNKHGSRKVELLLKESNISNVVEWIRTPPDRTYSKEFISGFDHIVRGHVKSKNVFGVHYFDPKTTRILEIVREDLVTGVCEAKIEVFCKSKNRWIEKKKLTTLFPRHWNIEQLFHECDFAYENKYQIKNKVNTYKSNTISGINVKIIIEDNKLKSIYPVFE